LTYVGLYFVDRYTIALFILNARYIYGKWPFNWSMMQHDKPLIDCVTEGVFGTAEIVLAGWHPAEFPLFYSICTTLI